MRYFSYPTVLSTALLLATGSTSVLEAGPAAPRERSFRPVVPIKQNVRGGMDQMKSQTVRLTIPPPPIPDTEATPATAATPGAISEADFAPPASSAATLPPEPKPADIPDPVSTTSTTAADKSEEADKTVGGSETTPEKSTEEAVPRKTGPTLSQLREEAHALAGKKLSYVFGADDPDTGGLDCSSTIQFLLTRIGIKDVPRTSYDQYYWLKRKNLLDDVYGKSASSKLLKKLSPGDLIFWGGTWKSGHRVSHVMLYMGYDPAADKHYVFGARSKSTTGLTGAGVDIFELDTERGRLVAHGKIPGLVYE